MKIAIMTLPLGANYGGIMQAWALQQVLKRMGHEPVTIDRQHEPKGRAYHAARISYRALKKALGKRRAPINFERHLPFILQHTRTFINQHINISEPLDSTAKLKVHFMKNQYDAVIVGSDQTWRPKYSPNIENFFLDFLERTEIKRIAYASSFGVDEWEFTKEQTRRCATLAKRFNAISVREDSGIQLCREHLGVEALHVLDPTLLLDKADYEHLIGASRLNSQPRGVYSYILDRTPEKLTLAEQLSKQIGEPLFSCQAQHNINEDHGDITTYTLPDIRDWLAGFANARIVLTDSFHGVIFSAIFRKDYRAIVNTTRGAARFKSIIKLNSAEQNSVTKNSGVTTLLSPTDYIEFYNRLFMKKVASSTYLDRCLHP